MFLIKLIIIIIIIYFYINIFLISISFIKENYTLCYIFYPINSVLSILHDVYN